MTEAAKTFGNYLKLLRERAGLSRPDVCRLASTMHETIDRGSLWRLENGEQTLSMGKVGTLARIYGVNVDVIFERWELDRDCEKIAEERREDDPLDLKSGRKALAGSGTKWSAYRSFREVLENPGATEDSIAARLNLATTMRSLGKNHLALHELSLLEHDAHASPLYPVILDRIANCHRCLGQLHEAEAILTRALEAANTLEDHRIVGVVQSSRANVAIDAGQTRLAGERLGEAIRSGRLSANGALKPSPGFEATLLNMLADIRLALREDEAAFEAAITAGKIGRRYGLANAIAYSELMLGRLADRAGKVDDAIAHFREVESIGVHTSNGRLKFAGKFYPYRRLVRSGEVGRAESIGRQLDRLRTDVPRHYVLLSEFLNLKPRSRTRGKQRRSTRRGPESQL